MGFFADPVYGWRRAVSKNSDLEEKRKMSRTIIVLLVFVFLCPLQSDGKETEKIAAASEGKTPSASVSSTAARCTYFLFFDGKGKFLEAVKNPHKNSGGRAGILAADFLAESNVTVFISGQFGNKMIEALKSMKIEYFESEGTVSDAVKKFLKQDKNK